MVWRDTVLIDLTYYLIQGGSILLGTAAFALIFRIRIKMIPFAAIGGFLAWFIWRLSLDIGGFNDFTANFMGAAGVTAYTEIMARICKTPSTVFMTPSILPLVPGGSIYSTMVALVNGNHDDLVHHGTLTIQVALGIASGIIVVSIIGTFFRPLKPSLKKKVEKKAIK